MEKLIHHLQKVEHIKPCDVHKVVGVPKEGSEAIRAISFFYSLLRENKTIPIIAPSADSDKGQQR